nr:hypothetical protein [Mycoplasmopsis bovis]
MAKWRDRTTIGYYVYSFFINNYKAYEQIKLIGKVYKQRNKENKFPITKDRLGDDIFGHGINRPYLILIILTIKFIIYLQSL